MEMLSQMRCTRKAMYGASVNVLIACVEIFKLVTAHRLAVLYLCVTIPLK